MTSTSSKYRKSNKKVSTVKLIDLKKYQHIRYRISIQKLEKQPKKVGVETKYTLKDSSNLVLYTNDPFITCTELYKILKRTVKMKVKGVKHVI